jgi:hypothetical protein
VTAEGWPCPPGLSELARPLLQTLRDAMERTSRERSEQVFAYENSYITLVSAVCGRQVKRFVTIASFIFDPKQSQYV